jgi:hypothetical protein
MELNCGRETKKSQEPIVEPTSLDILHGRHYLRHTGNRCFRVLVGFSLKEYKALSTPTEKNKFLNAIVKSIQMSGGRFLRRKHDDGGWEEIDLKQAKVKVRHAFRDAMMMRMKRPKIQEEGLSPVIKPYYISAEHFDWKGIIVNAESADRTSPREVILEPTVLDILHGRDGFSVRHMGNKCFHTVIGYSLKRYLTLSTRSDKSKLISALVDTIHNSGGRFLQRRPGSGGWEQDDVQKAKKMVGQTLQNAMKKPKKPIGSSLITVSHLFCYYNTAYDFDWRGMVAQCLQSEMKNSSARAHLDVSCEDDIISIPDLSVDWLDSGDVDLQWWLQEV